MSRPRPRAPGGAQGANRGRPRPSPSRRAGSPPSGPAAAPGAVLVDEPEADPRPRQDALMVELLTRRTIRAACEAAGVSERACRRWLHEDAAFRRRYRELRSAHVSEAVARLQAGAARAVGALLALTAGRTRDEVRLRAAVAVLDLALRGEAVENLAARVEALERGFTHDHVGAIQ